MYIYIQLDTDIIILGSNGSNYFNMRKILTMGQTQWEIPQSGIDEPLLQVGCTYACQLAGRRHIGAGLKQLQNCYPTWVAFGALRQDSYFENRGCRIFHYHSSCMARNPSNNQSRTQIPPSIGCQKTSTRRALKTITKLIYSC